MSQAFAVVIEETDQNFSDYGPDLPGCVRRQRKMAQKRHENWPPSARH
jgi:hypothetical protein